MSLYVDVEKNYRGFHFKVQFETQQNITGILGASGSGKSMTLKCIAGIVRPDKGRIVLNGRVLFDSDKGIDIKTRDRRTGYLFQNYALFPNMTVRQNILAGVTKEKRNRHREILRRMLDLFRLQGLEERKPHQISGGQQQRVALARIFAMEPEILMLDEPFSALDSNLKEFIQLELLDVLKLYQKEVLMVSHSRDEVFRFCDDMVVIDEGHSKRHGSVKEVFSDPQTLCAARLIGVKNIYPCKKSGEKTVRIIPWATDLSFRVPVRDDITHCAVRARSIDILEEKPEDMTNVIPIKVERVSMEFNFCSVVLIPETVSERFEIYDEDTPYILAKIPRNRWKTGYKNAGFVRLHPGDLFQLKDDETKSL